MPSGTKRSYISFFLYIILCVGFLFKIQNTSNTPNVTTSGGIWNIVTILLYICWFLVLFNKTIIVRSYSMFGVMFCFIATMSSIVHAKEYSLSFFYNLVTISYFMVVLSLFTDLGKRYGENALNLGVYAVTFFALALYVGYFMIGYQKTDDEMYVVADVYYPLNMLPLLLLMKNKPIKYSAIALTGFVLILSGKRTGFVALLIGLLVYYMVTAYCNRGLKDKSKTIFGMIFAAIGISLLFSYLTEYYNLDFLERLETAFTEGEGGREEIWNRIGRGLKESSFLEILFGHGLKSVPTLIGSKNALAHNDYLEILYDFGVIAFIFYIGFWLSMIGRVVSFIKKKNQYAAILAFALVIAMFLSMFSNYVIDATYITYSMITFGLMFGIIEWKEKNDGQVYSA